MTTPAARTGRAGRAARVVGVDAARCVALLGMMATHVLAAYDPATLQLSPAFAVAAGRASALFAVLAGVSLALTTGRTTPLRGRPLAGAATGVVVRAVLVTAVGLALGGLESGVAVILAYYGVMFLLAVPFLGLRAPALFALAVPWLLLVPVLSQHLRADLTDVYLGNPTFTSWREGWQLLTELTFTGHYPAVPWLGYLLLGMAIGRCDLRRWRAAGFLAVGGGAAAVLAVAVSDRLTSSPGLARVVTDRFGPGPQTELLLSTSLGGTTPTDSWWWLVLRTPHSGTPFDLVQTAGSACVVLGVCLVLGRLLPDVTRVVLGAGAATLTFYSLHVVLLATVWDDETTGTYLRHVAVALVLGALLALLRRRGPLEAAVAVVADRAHRLVAGASRGGVPAGARG